MGVTLAWALLPPSTDDVGEPFLIDPRKTRSVVAMSAV
jgi:hypothetical protein